MPAPDSYYRPTDLARFAEVGQDAPELWKAFQGWYSKVLAAGALSSREKALIGLAVAHATQCPYCIDAFTKGSLENGADLAQMTEAVHVAAAVRGGATLVHAVQMRSAAADLLM